MSGPRINVVENGRSITIEVNDYELFDWLEDLLVEKFGLEPQSYDDLDQEYSSVVRMNFDASISAERLKAAIDQLDWAEVERIYRLNND